MAVVRRLRTKTLALAIGALLLAGCHGDPQPAPSPTPTPTPVAMVTLGYQVPTGYARVDGPSRSPQPGLTFDIVLYEHDATGCVLQVMRVLKASADQTEDQDLTYSMVSGMASAQGVPDEAKTTDGIYFPGTPGPVPGLMVSGDAPTKSVRVAGRLSNESHQGFSAMMICPRGKLDQPTWASFIAQFRVDGFLGTLEEH